MKLKPLLLLGLLSPLMTGIPAYGRQLSPEEAVRKVTPELKGALTRTNPELLYTQEENGLKTAYVFASAEGYMVVAADDLLPALLGYSDTGTFDAASIPPAMKSWLSEYGRQLAFAVENNLQPYVVAADNSREAVAPLCNAKWSQSKPFNNNTPSVDGRHTPAGCTATAMAQLMYAHK